jgi:hypothetical protein
MFALVTTTEAGEAVERVWKTAGQKAVTEYELSGAETPLASELRCRRLPPIADGVAW